MKIYQIEISNLCNLTCSYCPHPAQHRPKGLMSPDTFAKALELLLRCGQRVAYLHNFGEPLLHPELPAFIRLCVERAVTPSFFTNGVLLTGAILEELAAAGLTSLCVSDHTGGELARIRGLIDSRGLAIDIRHTFRPKRDSLHTWAGQVASERAAPGSRAEGLAPCLFQRESAVVVLWDGRINVCCIDVDGRGVQGVVDDYLADPARYAFRPIALCGGCALMRGAEDLS